MKELMILVERAVRPVRADNRRKMRMRQELLAHLSAAYAQEQARLGDETAALAEAARRFGDPKELTRSLQAAVPIWDSILFMPIPGTKWLTALERRAARRSPTAPARQAIGWAVVWLLTCLPLAGAAFSFYQAGGDRSGGRLAAEWLGLTVGMCGVCAVFSGLTVRALSGPLRLTAVLWGAVCAAVAMFLPAVVLGGYMHVRLEIPVHYANMAVLTVVSWLGILGAALFARHQAAVRRLREEWTNLEIGD